MNKLPFPILLVICAITHIIRSVYEILKHKKVLVPNKFSFSIIFLNMIVLWTSWFILCIIDPLRFSVPIGIRYIGILLVIAGLILFFTALFTIKTLESYTGDLITTGIYSRIRHPMYLAFILWLFGPSIFYEAGISFTSSFMFTANILFWRHLEEIELEERFPDYTCYKKQTLF